MSLLNGINFIIIDQGATEAIFRGKSILPAGVINSEGRYDKGDQSQTKGDRNVSRYINSKRG